MTFLKTHGVKFVSSTFFMIFFMIYVFAHIQNRTTSVSRHSTRTQKISDQNINKTLNHTLILHKKSGKVEILRTETSESAAKIIFIAALWRGGSSFLGEIFNRNPFAMYLFEPDAMSYALSDKTYVPMVNYRDFRNKLQKLDAVFRYFSIFDVVENF